MNKLTKAGFYLCMGLTLSGVCTGCGSGLTAEQGVSAGTTRDIQVQMIPEQNVHYVSVSGKAEVKVVPDKASIDIGVELQERTAQDANEKLKAQADAVITALKSLGVEDKDILTDSYTVDVDYNWSGNVRKVTGYHGYTSITVSGIDISGVTSVIDAVVSAGANEIRNIQYYSSSYKERYDDALEQAINEAYAKAVKMGEAAGFRVLGVYSMEEGYQDTSARYVTNSIKEMDSFSMSEMADAVAPGEVSIEARVSVRYEIENLGD